MYLGGGFAAEVDNAVCLSLQPYHEFIIQEIISSKEYYILLSSSRRDISTLGCCKVLMDMYIHPTHTCVHNSRYALSSRTNHS